MASDTGTALSLVHDAVENGDIAYLISALTGTHRTARWMAAKGLGQLRAEQAYAILLRSARDAADETLRGICLTSLAELGNSEALEPVRSIATSPTPFAVRTTAMAALVRLGDRRGIEMLAAVVTDPDLSATYAVPSARPPIDVSAAKRWAANQIVHLKGVESIPCLEAALTTTRGRDKVRIRLLLRRLRSFHDSAGPTKLP
jgi:HEAT repeat protein